MPCTSRSSCTSCWPSPNGELQSRLEEQIVRFSYLLTTVAVIPVWLFADPSELDCSDCPNNVILISANKTLVDTASVFFNLAAVVLVGTVLVILVRRWRRATASQRRLLVPVYSAGVAVIIMLIVTVALQAGGLDASALDALWVAAMVPFGLVPYLFLATLVRARMIGSGAAGELMARLAEAPRRASCATLSRARSATLRSSSSTGCPRTSASWTPAAAPSCCRGRAPAAA